MGLLDKRPQLPKIKCAICDKSVDRIEASERPADYGVRFKVECHGDVDECFISHAFMAEASSGGLTAGVAFTTKRLVPA